MTKIPLIKRPIEELLTAARVAGRAAFATKATVIKEYRQIRYDWICSEIPSALKTMSDDAFGEVLEKAEVAFDAGVDEYLAFIEGKEVPNGDAMHALEREVKDEQFQVTCAQEIFVWLGGIFHAIQRAADACPDSRSRGEIKRLAACGNYLADDRADMLSDYAVPDGGGDHA